MEICPRCKNCDHTNKNEEQLPIIKLAQEVKPDGSLKESMTVRRCDICGCVINYEDNKK
jgi:hypothetical protein